MYVTTSSSSPASANASSRLGRMRWSRSAGTWRRARAGAREGAPADGGPAGPASAPQIRWSSSCSGPRPCIAATYCVTRPSAPSTVLGTSNVSPSLRAISSAPFSPRTGTTRPLRSARRISLSTSRFACPLPAAVESRLLPQDAGVQLLELRARLDPELADEERARHRGTPAAPLPAVRYGRARACATRTRARATGSRQRGSRALRSRRGGAQARCLRRCAPRVHRAATPRGDGSPPA